MQCECNVIILRISDSIDNWNDKPKHPIIANGANKYLTSGEIITESKIDEENFGNSWVVSDFFFLRRSKRTTYLEMYPTGQRDIENTR